MMSLHRFAKFAAMKRKHRKPACTAKDISDESVKGTVTRCFPLYSLKRRKEGKLGNQPSSQNPPASSVEKPGVDFEASPTGK